MKTENVAYLSVSPRYSIFEWSGRRMKFKTSPYLERYVSVLKWNNGYLECLAKYTTLPQPVEEYLDLRFIAERLKLPADVFENVEKVEVA